MPRCGLTKSRATLPDSTDSRVNSPPFRPLSNARARFQKRFLTGGLTTQIRQPPKAFIPAQKASINGAWISCAISPRGCCAARLPNHSRGEMMKRPITLLFAVLVLAFPALARERVIVLTDILNEPD